MGMGDADGVSLLLGTFDQALQLAVNKPGFIDMVDKDIAFGKGHLQ